MSRWTEVVTTALIGTERRPLPDQLPAAWAGGSEHDGDGEEATAGRPEAAGRVLALAARHRAVALTGAPLERVDLPPGPSSAWLPPAPQPAQELLASLLSQPEPTVVNLWLTAGAAHGLGVAPDLWTRLANLASRNTAYDRVALLRVLGDRGCWFLSLNPRWAVLSSAAPESPAGTPPGPSSALGLILETPDPWSAQVTRAALELVLDGALGGGTRAAVIQVASRLPLDLAVEDPASGPDGRSLDPGPPDRRPTPGRPADPRARYQRELTLALVERVLEIRRDIRDSFDARATARSEHQPGEQTS